MERVVGAVPATPHAGKPKRRDIKPFPRVIGDRLTKVALNQTQHESQSEERIKAERKRDPRSSSFSGTLGSGSKDEDGPGGTHPAADSGEALRLPRPKAKIPSVNSSRN